MPDPLPLHLVSPRPLACEECHLRAHCLPDHLDDEFAQTVARVIRPHQPIPRGTYLFRQGAVVSAFYFLRSGSAKSVVSDASGRESIMRFLFPSDLAGTASMDLTIYHDSVITLERSSFCELRSADLLQLFRDDPPALQRFLTKISDNILIERHARVRLEHSSADERVADFIVELADAFARIGRNANELYLTMSRYDIANYIGLAPETVSRVLRRFSDDNLIVVRHKQLVVCNQTRLRALAAG